MTVSEIVKLLNAKAVNISDGNMLIKGGYAGDFLSHVMGKAPTLCAWFTVMSNVNVAAVAILAEIGIIIICEGARAEKNLIDRCVRENINIIETDMDIYNAVVAYSKNEA